MSHSSDDVVFVLMMSSIHRYTGLGYFLYDIEIKNWKK
jgi:hypothetical protein